MAGVLFRHFGFPLDDSWIHQTVARNLAETHVLGFRRGVLSSGSTSFLWTLILAIRALLVPGLSPVSYNVILSTLWMAGIGFSLKRLTEDDGLNGSATSWCLSLAPLASGNFLWLGLVGMEHLLFLLLSLLVIRLWFQAIERPAMARLLPLALLCFLLAATRPEGLFLAALLIALNLLQTRRLHRPAVAAALGSACGWATTAAVNLALAGRVTPLTMQGRQWLGLRNARLATHFVFFEKFAMHLMESWGYGPAHRMVHGLWLLLGIPVALFLASLVALAVRRLITLRASRFLSLCLWGLVLLVLYSVVMPVIGHGGRYVSLPSMLFLPLVFLGLHQAVQALFQDRRLTWAFVAVLAACTTVLSFREWRIAAADGIDQINTEHGAMGLWLSQNLPPAVLAQGRFAVFDVGRIGYELHGNLIDLGGLVDAAYLPYLYSNRIAVYLQQRDVAYVVLPMQADGRDDFANDLGLNAAHGVRLYRVQTICSDSENFSRTFAMTALAFPCQRAYRIEYLDGHR